MQFAILIIRIRTVGTDLAISGNWLPAEALLRQTSECTVCDDREAIWRQGE